MFRDCFNLPERICPECGAKMELFEDSFPTDLHTFEEMYWKCTNDKCGCCLIYEGEENYEY